MYKPCKEIAMLLVTRHMVYNKTTCNVKVRSCEQPTSWGGTPRLWSIWKKSQPHWLQPAFGQKARVWKWQVLAGMWGERKLLETHQTWSGRHLVRISKQFYLKKFCSTSIVLEQPLTHWTWRNTAMKATDTLQDTVTFPVGGQDHPKQKSNKGGWIKRVNL